MSENPGTDPARDLDDLGEMPAATTEDPELTPGGPDDPTDGEVTEPLARDLDPADNPAIDTVELPEVTQRDTEKDDPEGDEAGVEGDQKNKDVPEEPV